MEEDSLRTIFRHVNDFWDNKIYLDKWHEGQVVPAPKKGNLADLNKWRGVNLMDIGSKAFSSILCEREFKIAKKHGTRYKFGLTPGMGCQEGSFTLKKNLHTQHNHNLPCWVMFADLVNIFDTVNHELLIIVLSKYGASKKICNAIQKLYKDTSVKLKIGKLTWNIGQLVGVKQGSHMSPALFLCLIMAFAEALEEERET